MTFSGSYRWLPLLIQQQYTQQQLYNNRTRQQQTTWCARYVAKEDFSNYQQEILWLGEIHNANQMHTTLQKIIAKPQFHTSHCDSQENSSDSNCLQCLHISETGNPDDCLPLLLYFPLVTHTTVHTIALSSHCITSCGKWWLPREAPLGGKKNHPARKVGGNVRTGQSGGPAPIITSWSSTCCHLGKQFHH